MKGLLPHSTISPQQPLVMSLRTRSSAEESCWTQLSPRTPCSN